MINPVNTAIPIPISHLIAFCERHQIPRLWLFGSILRADFDEDSDIDILVEFDTAHIPGWEFALWADELEAIFNRPVDLHTPQSLSRYIRDDILATAQLMYERRN